VSKIGVVGCGWLGLPLAVSLIQDGHAVIGTTTSHHKLIPLKDLSIEAHHWTLNGCSCKNSLAFLNQCEVLILNIPPGKINNSGSYAQALGNMCAHLSSTLKVVFLSTTSVYPSHLWDATEEYEWRTTDFQKETVQAEMKLRELLDNRLTILRLAGLLGLERHPVKQLAGKTAVKNGNFPVNLIHVEDAIGLIQKIIATSYWGQVVNGVFPQHPTRVEYYSKTARLLNVPLPQFDFSDGKGKIISAKKSIEQLGYQYTKVL
jgi:nucleoside-diphosphate-sugar epimerase